MQRFQSACDPRQHPVQQLLPAVEIVAAMSAEVCERGRRAGLALMSLLTVQEVAELASRRSAPSRDRTACRCGKDDGWRRIDGQKSGSSGCARRMESKCPCAAIYASSRIRRSARRCGGNCCEVCRRATTAGRCAALPGPAGWSSRPRAGTSSKPAAGSCESLWSTTWPASFICFRGTAWSTSAGVCPALSRRRCGPSHHSIR